MVYVLLADGFEEVEALLPIDILLRGGVSVKTVSISDNKTVVGSHGISVTADLFLSEIGEACELLFLPGGMPGAKNIDEHPMTSALIDRVLSRGGRVAAICAAPMILGKRGLLAGKKAVCYPGFERFLTDATVVSEPVVTDGSITTAIGMGAAAALGLTLLSLLKGEDTKRRVQESAFLRE